MSNFAFQASEARLARQITEGWRKRLCEAHSALFEPLRAGSTAEFGRIRSDGRLEATAPGSDDAARACSIRTLSFVVVAIARVHYDR
jgi:hypothetical protein